MWLDCGMLTMLCSLSCSLHLLRALQCESSAKKRKMTIDGTDVLNRKLSDFYPRMLLSGVSGMGGGVSVE